MNPVTTKNRRFAVEPQVTRKREFLLHIISIKDAHPPLVLEFTREEYAQLADQLDTLLKADYYVRLETIPCVHDLAGERCTCPRKDGHPF